jgi:type I restriction enzyme S subunit
MLNMVVMKLKDCCTIIAGQSPESKYYNADGIGIPFFQGKADFGELYPTVRVYCSQPTKIAEKDDILLSVRAPVGATNLAPRKVCIGRGLTAIRPRSNLELKYLLYFFRYFQAQLQAKGTGTTFKAITQRIVRDIELPVPSLPEQKRIVEKIEELFSELDSGVKTLKKTKQQLAVYRQAVLKAVFAHVTEKKIIREMSSVVTSGSRGWAQYYSDNGAKFIRIGNLTRDNIRVDLSDVQHVDLPEDAEGKRTQLKPNDVLVSITADLGSIGLVLDNIGDAYVNQHIAMVRFNNPAQGKVMAWYLRSDYGQKDLLKNKRGGGKLGLGLDDIRDTKVPVMSDDDAARILETIESRFSVCDSIEKTVDAALQQSEAMRQSILKKAFEGKL